VEEGQGGEGRQGPAGEAAVRRAGVGQGQEGREEEDVVVVPGDRRRQERDPEEGGLGPDARRRGPAGREGQGQGEEEAAQELAASVESVAAAPTGPPASPPITGRVAPRPGSIRTS